MRMLLPFALAVIAVAGGSASAHPADYRDHANEYVAPVPPVAPGPRPHTTLEAQIGGGLGRYAASNEADLGFSVGWHKVVRAVGWTTGNEYGVDLDLRLGDTRDGASIVVGVRPVARRLDGDYRTPSLIGLVLPEVAWSTGDGRERALRVEWTCPIAISLGAAGGLEWNLVRAGAVLADDGVHASFGTELRFVLR
jgi:hypothetical protein